MQFRRVEKQINKGKLTALVIALSSALSVMAAAHADTTVSSGTILNSSQPWTSANFTVESQAGVSVTGISAIAIDVSGSVETLSNSGNIFGSASGIVNHNGTINAISSDGTIGANNEGILNDGLIRLISNNGLIVNATGIGIYNNSGTISEINNNANGTIDASIGIDNADDIGSISNSGTIRGSYGVLNGISTIGRLTNSGLIQGTTAAIYSSGSLPNITNTGTIAGKIQNDSSNALTITGGSGAVFGTLTGSSGSITSNAIGTILSSGNLIFGGNQLLNDNVTIVSGSGTLTNTGVLQVNNPLTIRGNYTQGSGASLLIGVSSSADLSSHNLLDTGYGRLVVSGNVNLSNSGVTLTSLGYSFAQGQRYVVVASQGTITTTNTTYAATGYSNLVTGAVSTDTSNSLYQDLILTLSGISGNGTSRPINNATNGNASRMLGALFNYSGTDSSLLGVFNPAAALNTASSANRAGAQLSPAATANAVASASSAAFTAVQAAAGNRLDTLRTAQADGGGVSTGESSLAPALWGRLFGGQANQALRDGVSGYHASYGGFMLGSDVQVHPDWRVGGLFSLARTNIGNEGDNTGSSAGVNSYGLSAYAGYDGHPWYLNLSAGVARQMLSTTRAINYTGFSGTANGAFKGLLYSATAQVGYPLQVGSFTVTPQAGLGYSALRQDGYTESGGNGAALSMNGSAYTSLKSQLGAKLERGFMTSYGELRPFLQLGWNHEFHATSLTSTGIFAADTTGTTAFATQGVTPMRNTAQLSLGATLLCTGNLTLSARYTVEGARGYTAQTGDVTLRWQY
jgi:outer membrane autotransporter protein